MAAPTAGTPVTSNTQADPLVVTLPTYSAGTPVLVFVGVNNVTASTPSGWTLLASSASTAYLYGRVMDGGEGATVSVDLSASSQATGISVPFSGASGADPWGGMTPATNTDNPIVLSGTTLVADCLLVAFGAIRGGSGNTWTATGLTEFADVQAEFDFQQSTGAADSQASAGATGNKTLTPSGSGNAIAGFLLAVQPSTKGPPPRWSPYNNFRRHLLAR